MVDVHGSDHRAAGERLLMAARKRIVGWHADMAKRLKGLEVVRDSYDAIARWQPGQEPLFPYVPRLEAHLEAGEAWRARVVNASEVLEFFAEALPETYCSFDRHK